MIGFLSVMLFVAAGFAAVGVMAATIWPQRRRIAELLRQAAGEGPVEAPQARVIELRVSPPVRWAAAPALAIPLRAAA